MTLRNYASTAVPAFTVLPAFTPTADSASGPLDIPSEIVENAAPANIPDFEMQEFLAWKAAQAKNLPAENLPAENLPAVNLPSPALNTSTVSPESLGFYGFKLDFTSFPTISLKNDGQFEDTDGTSYAREFECFMISSRERFVYRALTGSAVEDNRKDIAFTYDQATFTNGNSLAQQVALWESQGKVVEIRDYLEVQVILRGGEHDGEWRLLSVPRLSIGRFWGFFGQLSHATKGKVSSVPIRVFVGEKVSKARQPWYPWNFAQAK